MRMRNRAFFGRVVKAANRLYPTAGVLTAVVIFVIALVVRLLAIGYLSPQRTPQHFEMDRIAISLSQGNGFSNPFPTATGPSAHYTPAYPLLLSLLYSLLGTGTEAELAKLLFNVTGTCLWLSMLPLVSKMSGAGFLPGVIAGLVGAVAPLHLWTELTGR